MAATHLAHHHPQLLGAAGPEVLQQTAEEVPGARPGQSTPEAGGEQTAARLTTSTR